MPETLRSQLAALRLAIFAALAVLVLPAVALAEFKGVTAEVVNGGLLTNLLQDPMLIGIIGLVISLVTSKFLHIDLTPFLLPLLNSLFKPPGTPPVVNPPATPPVVTLPATPTTPATPLDLPALLQVLLKLLTDAKASGDKDAEAAALLMLNRLSGAK